MSGIIASLAGLDTVLSHDQHEMLLRAVAAQASLDTYQGRSLTLGMNDCVRMTGSHLRRLGFKVKLPAAGSYRTLEAAKRALKERGFETSADALDAMGFERIAPAAAVVADVVMLPGVDELGSLTIALGNGRVLGFHPDARNAGAAVLQPVEFITAWRTPPNGIR